MRICDVDARRERTFNPGRAWHSLRRAVAALLAPGCCRGEFTEQTSIRPVKILGEELVVYRDKQGKYGLVGEHCPHRLASLAYGRVDDEDIRCPYHRWKFDRTGKCPGTTG